jgi:hypothetical protein
LGEQDSTQHPERETIIQLPAPVIIINEYIQNIQLKDINKGRDQIYPALVIFPNNKVDRIYRTNQAEEQGRRTASPGKEVARTEGSL